MQVATAVGLLAVPIVTAMGATPEVAPHALAYLQAGGFCSAFFLLLFFGKRERLVFIFFFAPSRFFLGGFPPHRALAYLEAGG